MPISVKNKKTMIISLINLIFVYVFLCVSEVKSTELTNHKLDRRDEKVLIKPIGLVHLSMKKRRRPGKMLIDKDHENKRELDSQFRKQDKKAVQINNEVDAGALARKVWSRWGKWGECSVTCGRGAKTRRRLCLGGRCAPGEREEQRLFCCRQPCELN